MVRTSGVSQNRENGVLSAISGHDNADLHFAAA